MNWILQLFLASFLLLWSWTEPTYGEKALVESQDYEDGLLGPSPTQQFAASNFTPIEWNIVLPANNTSKLTDGLMFMAPRSSAVIQPGPTIFNQDGTLVWSGAQYGQTLAFLKVIFNGRDHLAFWSEEGAAITPTGFGAGHYIFLNQAYEIVANITPVNLNGTLADFHEIQVTADNTAIMTAYPVERFDLTPFNGSAAGFIVQGAFQELNVTTGEEIFTWKSLDHVDPSESFAPLGAAGTGTSAASPWDYFHINSVIKDTFGNYLISSRHTHTVYYIDGSTGDIIWRLGGKNSNFTIGEGAEFAWQHDPRWINSDNTQLSLFNNDASDFSIPPNGTARGLILNIDQESMNATLALEVLPFVRNVTVSQGSVSVLEGGNILVGWGARPYFSEYDSEGNILNAVHFGVGDVQSYRVLISNWTARPSYPPTVNFTSTSPNEVFASWNGATEVASWDLFGTTSSSPQHAILLNSTKKVDFETGIGFDLSSRKGNEKIEFFQIAAKNVQGKVLAFSEFRSRDGMTVSAAKNQTVEVAPLV